MREMMKSVNHQQASQLLHNKFVVVLGDSIQRSVYKDLVVLLQKDKYLSLRQLKSKGEMSFEQDCLVEGGCLSQMTNGTEYREVRQFQSDHHLVRFYFVTRIFSRYMESIIEDFRHGLKPDVVIVNSCVWDISRYNSSWVEDYTKNLHKFFDELSENLPEETLVMWNLTMPLGKKIRGGFLVSEIEHKAAQLRCDVVEANFFSGTLADAYDKDVLDLHFQFRFSLHHRTKDGIHWNAIAHRRITCLLLQHIAQAWGVMLPCPLVAVGDESHSTVAKYNREELSSNSLPFGNLNWDNGPLQQSYQYEAPRHFRAPLLPLSAAAQRHPYQREEDRHEKNHREEFSSNSLPFGNLNWDNGPLQQSYQYEAPRDFRAPLLPLSAAAQRHPYQREEDRHDFNYRPPHHFEPYREHHHQHVMRSRHARHQYVPYTHHRPPPRRGYY